MSGERPRKTYLRIGSGFHDWLGEATKRQNGLAKEEHPLKVQVFSVTSDDPMESYSYLVEEPEQGA